MIEPLLIQPDALFDDGTLCLTMGLPSSTIAAARRNGSLRYARQGKRTLYKGAWILDWLEASSEPRHRNVTGSSSQPNTAV